MKRFIILTLGFTQLTLVQATDIQETISAETVCISETSDSAEITEISESTEIGDSAAIHDAIEDSSDFLDDAFGEAMPTEEAVLPTVTHCPICILWENTLELIHSFFSPRHTPASDEAISDHIDVSDVTEAITADDSEIIEEVGDENPNGVSAEMITLVANGSTVSDTKLALSAMACFDNICTTVDDTTHIEYDLSITDLNVSPEGTVSVTAQVDNPTHTATFAEGAKCRLLETTLENSKIVIAENPCTADTGNSVTLEATPVGEGNTRFFVVDVRPPEEITAELIEGVPSSEDENDTTPLVYDDTDIPPEAIGVLPGDDDDFVPIEIEDESDEPIAEDDLIDLIGEELLPDSPLK